MQRRIRTWVESRLGPAAMSKHERALRMLEEASELAQACGVTTSEACLVAEHVWARPVGETKQELGGAALTLIGCAEACGQRLQECAIRELQRIELLPSEKFRRRQRENASRGIGEPLIERSERKS